MDIRRAESPRKRQKVSMQQAEVACNVLSNVTNRSYATGVIHGHANEKAVERGAYDHKKRHSWRARQATLQRLNNFLGGSRGSPASSPELDVKRSDNTDRDACSRPSEPRNHEGTFTTASFRIWENERPVPFFIQKTHVTAHCELAPRSGENYCTSAEQEARRHGDELASPGQQCQPVTPSPFGSSNGSLLKRCSDQQPYGDGVLSPRQEKVLAHDSSGKDSIKSAAAEIVGWQAAGHLKPLPSALLSPPLPMTTPSPWKAKLPRQPSLTPSPYPLISSVLPATKKTVFKTEKSSQVKGVSGNQEQQQGSGEKGEEDGAAKWAADARSVLARDGLVEHADDGREDGVAQGRSATASLSAVSSVHVQLGTCTVQVKAEEALGVRDDPVNSCTLLTCPSSPKLDNTRFVEAFAHAADTSRGISKDNGGSGGRQDEEGIAATSAAPGSGGGDYGSLPHLQRLNPEQLAAATASPDRPLLVLAGPGSGKVRGEG